MAATTLSPAAAVPTATARSHWHPSTASTAADQCRRRRLGALSAATAMAQHRRPQINADGDGSEPSRHSVDGRRSVPQATARSPLSGDGDGAEPSHDSIDGHRSTPTATSPSHPATASTAADQRRRRRLGALSAATATARSPPATGPLRRRPHCRHRPARTTDGDGSEPSCHSVGSDEPSLGLRQRRHVMQRSSLSTTTVSWRRAQPLELCARESLHFLAVHQPCRHRSFTLLARFPRSPAHNTPSPCPLVFGSGNPSFSVSGWH